MTKRIVNPLHAFGSVLVWLISLSPPLWSIELPVGPFSNLKSEKFREREAAQAELLAWARRQPGAVMDEFYRRSREADDPEVRERCLAVLRELVNDEYLKDENGEGYIGIRMMDEMAAVPGDPKQRGAIRVIDVVRDSAAQRAGLMLGDLIVGLGDLVWRDGLPSKPFGDRIRQLKPNTKVTLKVLRKGELVDVEITLGRRPLIADNPFLQDMEAAERTEREAYFRRWLEQRKAGD